MHCSFLRSTLWPHPPTGPTSRQPHTLVQDMGISHAKMLPLFQQNQCNEPGGQPVLSCLMHLRKFSVMPLHCTLQVVCDPTCAALIAHDFLVSCCSLTSMSPVCNCSHESIGKKGWAFLLPTVSKDDAAQHFPDHHTCQVSSPFCSDHDSFNQQCWCRSAALHLPFVLVA